MMKPLLKKKLWMFAIYWRNAALAIIPKSFNEITRALIILFISLVLTDQLLESSAVINKLQKGSIDFLSLAIVIVAYGLIHCLLIAPFIAQASIKDLGFWDSDTFHYNKEQLIYTGVIHPPGQKLVRVIFPTECKGAFVNTRTTVSGAEQRVKAGFTCMKQGDHWVIHTNNGTSRCGIRLKGRQQTLVTESQPDTIPIRAQVFLESWTL